MAGDPSLSGIVLGNYEHTDHHVAIGEHAGNHFKIVLRNVRGDHVTSDDVTATDRQTMEGIREAGHMTSDDVTTTIKETDHMTSDDVTMKDAGHMISDDVATTVPQAVEGTREAGFINYFGPQRFGSSYLGTGGFTAPCSSLIGLAMLKNNYVSDILLISISCFISLEFSTLL